MKEATRRARLCRPLRPTPSTAARSPFPIPDFRLLVARAVVLGREILEFRVLAEERQLHRSSRAVTLLADDDLGLALVGRFLVVVLVSVDEDDHVGVLLDGAGFAQVG